MINGRYEAKKNADKLLGYIVKALIYARLTPNIITCLGLFLIICSSIHYVYYKNNLLFALFLSISFSADALDGAVARKTGSTSSFGGYLDAVFDRYQEIAVHLSIAFVNDIWLVSFLAVSGSLMTSYNKARAAMVIPVENDQWPDLLERTERLFVVITALFVQWFFPEIKIIFFAMCILAFFAWVTSIQRFFRAKRRIEKFHDEEMSKQVR